VTLEEIKNINLASWLVLIQKRKGPLTIQAHIDDIKETARRRTSTPPRRSSHCKRSLHLAAGQLGFGADQHFAASEARRAPPMRCHRVAVNQSSMEVLVPKRPGLVRTKRAAASDSRSQACGGVHEAGDQRICRYFALAELHHGRLHQRQELH
jgi:hypothetical protein